MGGLASLSHLTIQSCKGKIDGSDRGPTLSSFRRRHSAPKSSPLAFVHGTIGTIVAGKGTDGSSICTSISQLNETIYAKNSFVLMVDGRACAKGIRA